MAQLKKFGIFDVVLQYLNQRNKELGALPYSAMGGYAHGGDITGRFIHRGKKRRAAYRHGRGKGWRV
jgi:hypothetical protein